MMELWYTKKCFDIINDYSLNEKRQIKFYNKILDILLENHLEIYKYKPKELVEQILEEEELFWENLFLG